MADTLSSLAAELVAMSSHERNAILRALSADERTTVERAITEGGFAGDPPTGADPTTSSVFSFDLAQAISAVRQATTPAVTASSRAALLAAVDAIDAPGKPSAARSRRGNGARSLFDAFGGMLSARQSRP